MKTLLIAGACALALAGCASGGVTTQALQNLPYCERQYTAIIGALGANGGSLNIRCPARPFPTDAAPPAGEGSPAPGLLGL